MSMAGFYASAVVAFYLFVIYLSYRDKKRKK